MINRFIIFSLGFLSLLIFFSCEKENEIDLNNEFKIQFNNGKTITGKDILFYDRSTHLIYLKSDLEFENQSITDFNVSIGGDTIYQGVIYSCNLSSMSPSPYYIVDCFLYGNDILEVGYYGESSDLRNDQRILDALENSNLLRNGISCQIDKVEIQSFEDFSKVICTITIQNNDNFNYYILDPEKIGNLNFNYFTGGLTLQNVDTKLTYPLRWSVRSGNWSTINPDDLFLLKKGSKVTFTFESSDYNKMDPGQYSAGFQFCGASHHTPDIKLDQKDGRVWVGKVNSDLDNIVVED